MKKNLIIIFLILAIMCILLGIKIVKYNSSILENSEENSNGSQDIQNVNLEEVIIMANNLYGRDGVFIEVTEENERYVISVKNKETLNVVQTFFVDKNSGLITEPSREVFIIAPNSKKK